MSTNHIASTFAAPRPGSGGSAPVGEIAAMGPAGILARMGRWITLLVAVSAMALMLAGTMAEPAAAARPNLGTVAERCADMGGDASVYGVFGVNFTYCDWGDGTGVWGMD